MNKRRNSSHILVRWNLAAVVIFGIIYIVPVSPAHSEIVYKSKINGDAGWMQQTDECRYWDVSISRNNNSEAELSYLLVDFCSGIESAFGFGKIPNNLFTGNAHTGNLVLKVDVGALNEFYYTGTAPSFDLTWKKTGICEQSIAGMTKTETVSEGIRYTQIQMGNSKSFCSKVNAVISGPFSFEGELPGYIGASVSFDKTIEKSPAH